MERDALPVPAWLEGRGGQPEGYCHRQMMDAIRYVTDNGIKWRSMPADFPAWDRVYAYFRRWRDQGLAREFHDRLRGQVRESEGRHDGARRVPRSHAPARQHPGVAAWQPLRLGPQLHHGAGRACPRVTSEPSGRSRRRSTVPDGGDEGVVSLLCAKQRHRRPSRLWLLPVLAALVLTAAACVNSAGSQEGTAPRRPSVPVSAGPADSSHPNPAPDTPPSASSSAPAAQPTTGPEPPPHEAPPPSTGASRTHPGCLTGTVAVTVRPGELATQRLCLRAGASVTAVVPPGPSGPWSGPRTSSPMLAPITAKSMDPDGTWHVAIRAARPGSATVTWGTEGATVLTLQLDVAAYLIS